MINEEAYGWMFYWNVNHLDRFKKYYKFDERVEDIIKYYSDYVSDYLDSKDNFLEYICEQAEQDEKLFIIKKMKKYNIDYKKWFKD